MNRVIRWFGCVAVSCCAALTFAAEPQASSGENLLVNGDFEKGLEGWNPAWSRDANAIHAAIDEKERRDGDRVVRVEHTGQHDWSFANSLHLKVQPGEIYEFSAWLRLDGKGHVGLSVVTLTAAGKESHWNHGVQTISESPAWKCVKSRFVVPADTAIIWPRMTGWGPGTVWFSHCTLARQGNVNSMRVADLPASVAMENAAVAVVFRTADAAFELKDLRTNRAWTQQGVDSSAVVLDAKKSDDRTIDIQLLEPLAMRKIAVKACLDAESPELVVALHSEGEMNMPLAWPAPFNSAKGQSLILPVNEGISYPADEPSIAGTRYYLYGGHGLCMPWYGVVEGEVGWLAIVETPDDAAVSIANRDGLLTLAPSWVPQKQQFGPDRAIRYVLVDKGGYVAMAGRYREYAKKMGLFKTLAEKRKAVPAVDRLVGAVNIWCWDQNAVARCQELQAAGIRRILWSNAVAPDQIKGLNELGVLTSRYDIYQDAMNPEWFPRLGHADSLWTSDAWKNDDLMTDQNGQWVRGWQVKAKDGEMLPCGTLCDRQALPYAKRRIPADLETRPYACRFVDTTTASPWRECYHPKHPMTRTESKHFKMELLRYISEGCGLVCGSETGHDAAVPFVDYFEGMLSLAPYRVPDSGRDIGRIWDDVPNSVAKFQTGHFYRLPLWELVYHDCVVAHWYWGDYNNKLPKLWDRRDLWNALYGTSPMFMFHRKLWNDNKDRFVKSYQTTTAVARATGYSQMLSHAWLTPDHAVQQTRFANGVVVTANFGDSEYVQPDGTHIPSLGLQVVGLPDEK